MSGGHIVNPRLERITNGLDPESVPLSLLESFSSGGVIFKRIEPAAAALVVNACGKSTAGRIDLDLVTMDPAIIFKEVALTL